MILGFIVVVGLLGSLLLLNEHKGDLFTFHKNSDKMISFAQDIRYYDEVLTMSVSMAAYSGSLEWIERYYEAVEDLEDSILKAKEAFPEMIEYLNQIEKVNRTLIVLEERLIALIKKSQFAQAQAILSSREYNQNKRLYTQSLERIEKLMESSIHDFDQEAQRGFNILILIITLVILLLISFFIWSISVFRKQTKDLAVSRKSLKAQHDFLQKIINLVPVRIFWKDMEGVFMGANESFVMDAQLNSVSEIIGKTDYEMTWKRDAKRFRDDDAAVIASGIPRLQYEEEQPKEDGSVIHLMTSKVPLRDMDDKIIGILGVYHDITEQKRLEYEAKEKEQQLFKQAKHAQMGEMIAMIAHQWRQPLSAIAATVGALEMKRILGTINDQHLETELGNISSYTQHLSKTIDDFRAFLQEEKEKQVTTLEAVAEGSLAIIQPLLKAHNISVIKQYQGNTELSSYPNELKQVLINLIQNAKEAFDGKEIEEKRVEIKTYQDQERFYLEVYDNAGGIDQGIIEKIFGPYYTTKGSLNGTGLGLYMSKMIIEDHLHGKISAINKDDGVSFVIELSQMDH